MSDYGVDDYVRMWDIEAKGDRTGGCYVKIVIMIGQTAGTTKGRSSGSSITSCLIKDALQIYGTHDSEF